MLLYPIDTANCYVNIQLLIQQSITYHTPTDTASHYVTISLLIQQTITLLYPIDKTIILLIYPYVTTIYYDTIFLPIQQATMLLSS